MSVRVYIDERIVAPEEARVSVFDRQFLYGDGIFETLRTFGGRLFLGRAHLARLRGSAKGVRLPLPWSDGDLLDVMERTVAAAGNEESIVRLMITRGEGPFGLDPLEAREPRRIVIVRPLTPLPEAYYREGVDVVVSSIRRISPRAIAAHIKSGNYLNQALALAEGRRRGAFEVVMLSEEGCLAECSTSNLFFVRSGTVHTPGLEVGILPGLTRALVIGLARQEGLAVRTGRFPLQTLFAADEAFLTASIKGIVPIRRCDGKAIGAGVPGEVTTRLSAAFSSLAARAADDRLAEEEIRRLLGDAEENAGQ